MSHTTIVTTDKVDEQKSPNLSQTVSHGISVIQAFCQGTSVLSGIPVFTEIDKKRRWILEHMAGAFRIFARKGFSEGLAGHISVRDPEFPNAFWTNPIGRHFGLMKVSDMVLLNERGEPIGGNTKYPANAAGFQIHGQIHAAYPRINAACHAHSINGRAWSSFGRPLEMLNQDVCNFFGDALRVYNECAGVVLDPREGARIAASLGPKGKGLILRNHGLLTVGQTVDEAAYLFTLLEASCEAQLKTEAAAANGLQKIILDDETAAFTFQMTSDPESHYCEFQPDYEYELEATGGTFLH
ncbi:hypothetical protein N7448_004436 [Penicillium atrosanguineum]|nr:hypothetical protein N7448_004436 [Penicillium atrosanguineum]